MGCFPDKPNKQAKNNPRNTTEKQRLSYHSPNGQPAKGNMSLSVQKQGQEVEQINQSQSITQTGPPSYNYTAKKKAIQQLVKKYKIQVKQTAYKTSSIHAYSYQQLLSFNPPADIFFKIEKDLNRSYINLNRDLVLPSKFRLTNR